MSRYEESRAAACAKRQTMTLAQKIAQTRSVLGSELRKEQIIAEDGNVDRQRLSELLPDGIGAIQLPFTGATAETRRRWLEDIQAFLKEDSSAGIPALIHDECLHGMVGKGTTNFPAPLALAASFDLELTEQVYDVIGRETAARGGHAAHTPVLDLARDPRWGRTIETFGEDTFLVSRMGVAAVKGMQGGPECDGQHVITHLKHFAGYGQSEGGRNFAPTNISGDILHNQILPPFEAAVREAGALGIMPSHNELDGIPCHGNSWLLNDVLRDAWSFRGIVVTDFYDIERLAIFHHVANDRGEAAELALRSGVDMDLPQGTAFGHLQQQIENDPALEQALDKAVDRILTIKFLLGLFSERMIPPVDLLHRPEHVELAKQAAAESIVLLKNDGVLPVPLDYTGKIAVIGPHSVRVDTGPYSPPSEPESLISIYDALIESLDNVSFELGCSITRHDKLSKTELETTAEDMRVLDGPPLFSPTEETESIGRAVALAAESDLVVLCVGGNTGTGREAIFFGDDRGDRDDLSFPGNQEALIDAVLDTSTPVVALVFGSRPLVLTKLADRAAALLNCFYLGEQGGAAVADCVLGRSEPSGRLPISMPRSVGQIPVYYAQKRSGWYRNYLFVENGPLYPFGFGLSYTDFSYGAPVVSCPTMKHSETVSLSIPVENRGHRAGSTVVQLYVRDCVSSVTRPERELRGFKRLVLAPGEQETVVFDVSFETLASRDREGRLQLESGDFDLLVGSSCQDIQTVTITVADRQVISRRYP